MDFITSLVENWPSLYAGLKLTLELLLASIILGLSFASFLTAGSFLSNRIKKGVEAYIFIIRGTPMLVQFYFIYYGLAQLQWLHNTFFWNVIMSPIACSIIALAMNTSAYTTIILRGAFLGIPRGERDAGKALGLNRVQIFRKIILPRALNLTLPVYSNEVLMLLKGTSLASTITVLELTGITEQLIGETYQTIFYWLLAGAIYLLISAVIIGIFKTLEYTIKN